MGTENNIMKQLLTKDYATLLGTFFGVWSIVLSIEGNALRAAGMLIFLCLGTDLLDGYLARKLNQMNELGKELDSLSDCVCFGVAPAVLMFRAYSESSIHETVSGIAGLHTYILLFPCIIFVMGAVIRLAWFNIDKGEGYTGLITPLSAALIIFVYMIDYFWYIAGWGVGFSNFVKYLIPIFMVILAYLNVSPYLVYGKEIRKKSASNLKIVFALIGALGITAGILGSIISLRDRTAPFIVGIILIAMCLFIYYIYFGFKGYIISQKNDVGNKTENKTEEIIE